MKIKLVLFIADAMLINVAFVTSYFFRYGLPFPEINFSPYKRNFVFLTLIYMAALSFFGAYKARFRSSWELFQRLFLAVFLATLLSVALVYVFRIKWGGFPTSVFAISFLINLVLVFKLNQFVLRVKKNIKKHVVILGRGKVEDIVSKKANVERKQIDEIRDLLRLPYIDEIVVTERINNPTDLNLLLYLERNSKAQILFTPFVYVGLLPERINGNSSVALLNTFVGKQSDIDESLIRTLDIAASILILLLLWPVMILISLLIKATSSGTVFYKQQRIGKDGNIFVLYKFRTMIKNAEQELGPTWASKDDPRVTKVGRLLRTTRLDELPQLFNVLRGDMSLVGPRPERPHFVKKHKALREMRLAIKPGLTGLAQIRSFYDLKPKHKIKYDYLYIQRRSPLLNLYILARTIPVIFSKKGW